MARTQAMYDVHQGKVMRLDGFLATDESELLELPWRSMDDVLMTLYTMGASISLLLGELDDLVVVGRGTARFHISSKIQAVAPVIKKLNKAIDTNRRIDVTPMGTSKKALAKKFMMTT